MNLDQMLEAWRSQNETPLYGVNRDLLQLIIQHEQRDLRRGLRGAKWLAYGVSALLLAFFAIFFASIDNARTAWDYAAAGIAIGATLLFAGAFSVSHKRQVLRERGFGNSLQEEIRRNLSVIDYLLSRSRRKAQLLNGSPMVIVGILIGWLIIRADDGPSGWYIAGALFLFNVVIWLFSPVWTSRLAEKQLLPYRRRLSELLELLNSSE
jgi:hypothetical protein